MTKGAKGWQAQGGQKPTPKGRFNRTLEVGWVRLSKRRERDGFAGWREDWH